MAERDALTEGKIIVERNALAEGEPVIESKALAEGEPLCQKQPKATNPNAAVAPLQRRFLYQPRYDLPQNRRTSPWLPL